MEKHKKEMAKMRRREALAKTSTIEEFKEVMEGAASLYFGEGFNLCKKKIGILHPKLDIEDLQINPDLVDEDEEEKKDVPDANLP